ncbi:MAG: hypothetical protein Q4C77_03715 [Eubacteriales bacterium]|nr:hypothetical protein [Eubacteriales bacterium]
MKQYEINRKLYKDIKKMDHGQMNRFCQGLYERGYAAGKKDAEGLTETELKGVLLSVKGIGEAKASAIIDAVNLELQKKGGRTLTNG